MKLQKSNPIFSLNELSQNPAVEIINPQSAKCITGGEDVFGWFWLTSEEIWIWVNLDLVGG